MKKNLFFLAAGLLTLSACTSEEVVDVSSNPGNVIGFQNVVNKSTRAEVSGDLTNDKFDNFLVYGYYTKNQTRVQIFDGVSVHKNDDKEWVYNGPVRYWVPGYTYNFYAYSCADLAFASEDMGKPSFDVDKGTFTIDYTCDSKHQHDLVTAKNEGMVGQESGDNEKVGLSFQHALCKIKASFTTDFPEEYQIYVSDIKVTDFYNKATFTVKGVAGTNDGSWSSYKALDPTAYVDLSIEENSFVQNDGKNTQMGTSEAFLIPKSYGDEKVKIHFTVIIKNGEDIILERNVIGSWSPDWNQGNIYQYKINITGTSVSIDAIEFDTTQTVEGAGNAWEDPTEVEMEFELDSND